MSVHCSSYADWTAPGLRKKKEIKVAQSKGRGQKAFIAKKNCDNYNDDLTNKKVDSFQVLHL